MGESLGQFLDWVPVCPEVESVLPVEEEGRLNDPRLRENLVERIFAYRRLTALFATRWSMGSVVVDCVRRNRRGQRAEICGRRTGEAGELLETLAKMCL